jgi:hypothetical protein
MYIIQTSQDLNIEELKKEVEKELIETVNKKHIDNH